MLHLVQLSQSRNQHHGRIANREEDPLFLCIHDTPARPAGEIDGPTPIALQSQNLKLRSAGVVTDAGDDRGLQGRNDRDAVRSRPGIQERSGFPGARIDPSQTGAATVRHQRVAFGSNNARRFGKARQRDKVLAAVSVDHLKGIPGGVRDEDAARRGFKSPMVERCSN